MNATPLSAGSSDAGLPFPLDIALHEPTRWVVVSDDPRGGDHTKVRTPVSLVLRWGALEAPVMERRAYLAHYLDQVRGHLALGCQRPVGCYDPIRGLFTVMPCGAVPAVRDEVEDELLCAGHAGQAALHGGIEGLVSL